MYYYKWKMKFRVRLYLVWMTLCGKYSAALRQFCVFEWSTYRDFNSNCITSSLTLNFGSKFYSGQRSFIHHPMNSLIKVNSLSLKGNSWSQNYEISSRNDYSYKIWKIDSKMTGRWVIVMATDKKIGQKIRITRYILRYELFKLILSNG